MEAAYAWWSKNRSAEQAVRWYNAFADAIRSLSQNPERCALSFESVAFRFEIRDLVFGVGKRPTHRAVFSIRGNMVVVVAVRHLAQKELQPEDV
ncbi:MAG: type II toxin-antitoxin system RelE/ParE family toxin [Planctomycetia bacterium]|nr:type II toxin-antitoxin system RelE/ParE family toxin [Planctomycetia bacterium]